VKAAATASTALAGRKPATAGLAATLRAARRADLEGTLDILLLLSPRQVGLV
jgi:hypothetical protein